MTTQLATPVNDRRVLTFHNPALDQTFGEIPMASPAEIVEARQALKRSFATWGRVPVAERVQILRKLQKAVVHYADEISLAINQDTGKSRQDGLIEVIMVADKLHLYLKHATRWLGRRTVPPGIYFFRRYTVQPHPVGVVAVIGPWNYPFDLGMPPIFSALLAGNCVLYKPSEVAGATGLIIQKIIESVPEISSYVRVLHGDATVGAAVVQSEPDLIFLTGSVATGQKVGVAAAEKMIPFLFELGGKDPMIVLEDADLDAAARWGVWGAMYNAGQTCMGVERVYVADAVYERFLERVLAEVKKLKLGYTREIDSPFDLGPLAFERQMRLVQDHLDDAVAKGARIVYGGQKDGFFLQPTILVDVNHNMKIMKEETFGPVMPIMRVRDEAEAIRLANDSDYGLSACVWSRDLRRGMRVAGRLEVGSVNVNDAISHYPVSSLPFGGVKKSGTARTHGKQEVLQFTRPLALAVGVPPLPVDIATVMRQPGHYWLGKAVMQAFFGVGTQRLEAVNSLAAELESQPAARKAVRTALAAGAVGLLLRLWRRRRA